MSEWITKYTCGSCKYYEFEGENSKGYCSWYKAYYYPTDSCRNWEESDSFHSGTAGCFLTTACCEYKGLADDCYELQKMRSFRDEYILKELPDGKNLISDYYKMAPGIVSRIQNSINKEFILKGIYSSVCKIIGMINSGQKERAIKGYKEMVENVKNVLTINNRLKDTELKSYFKLQSRNNT